MPSYDYRCRDCDTTFEVTRSVYDDVPAVVPCPQGHRETTRVFTAVGVGAGASTGSAPRAAGGGCCGGGCCG